MAYINVDEVYILDNTGAQVDAVTDIPFKADAGLTDAQKAQARQNLGISAGGGERNLLDNWYFPSGSVVNQRGFSSGSTEGYTVDRWKVTRSSIITATIGSTGMTISKSVSGYAFFEQKIGNALDLEADYTLSVMTADGTVYSATRKFVNGTSSETTVTIGGMNVGFGLYGKDGTPRASLYFGTSATGSIVIKAIKLELGSTSTLAQDAPPDYATELDKCLYYFERIKASANLGLGTGIGNGTKLYTPFSIHPKRATPTITYTGSISIGRSAVETAITGIYTAGTECDYSSGHIQLGVNVTNTSGTPYRLILEAGGTLDFSADL